MDAISNATSIRDLLSLVEKDCGNNDPEVLVALIDKFNDKIQKLERSLTSPKSVKLQATCREILLNTNHKDHKACVQDLFETYSKDCAKKMENRKNEEEDAENNQHAKSKKGRLGKKKGMKGQVRKAVLTGLRKVHKTMAEKAAWVLEQANLEIKDMREDLDSLRTIKETLEDLLRCHKEESAAHVDATEQSEGDEQNNFVTHNDKKTMTRRTRVVHNDNTDLNACNFQREEEEEDTETSVFQPDNASDEFRGDDENRDDDATEQSEGEEEDNFVPEKDKKTITRQTKACNFQRQEDEEDTETRFFQGKDLLDCTNNTSDELHFDNENEGDTHDAKFLAFCRSIGPSTDINGNLVELSTQHKTHALVEPQLCKLENPNDPNLKCSTCQKQIDNTCSVHYCRPCQQVRICDDKKCAILHHCKIRKPKAFCICGQDAMFLCKRCENKAYCSSTCQTNDWKRHKVNECQLPLID